MFTLILVITLYRSKKIILSEIVHQCIETLKPLLAAKKMNCDFKGKKSILICNKKQIEALVQILLENAINYSEPNSSVYVTITQNERGRTVLSVRDKGIGIEEKNLKNIFREYFRTNRAVKKSYNGSGLGLAIARRIAELHRSGITVDSIPGKGSTFSVEFPK